MGYHAPSRCAALLVLADRPPAGRILRPMSLMTRAAAAFAACFIALASNAPGLAQELKSVRADLQPAARRRAAPRLALQDRTGKTVRLTDSRGRVVLLDFWATSCGGCVQEIPMFV